MGEVLLIGKVFGGIVQFDKLSIARNENRYGAESNGKLNERQCFDRAYSEL